MRELFSKITRSRRRSVEQLTGGVFGLPTLRSFAGGEQTQSAVPTTQGSLPDVGHDNTVVSRHPCDVERLQTAPMNQVDAPVAQTAGMVFAVRLSLADAIPPPTPSGEPWPFDVDEVPYMLLITCDGLQLVRLSADAAPGISALSRGRWAEFAGEQVHQHLFHASSIIDVSPAVAAAPQHADHHPEKRG